MTSPPGTNFSAAVGDVDVTAGGADVWGTSDEFHFVYQTKVGDFDVKAKVQRLDRANNWSKAGLMARETLDGNSITIESYTDPVSPGANTFEFGRRVTVGTDTLDWGTRPTTTIPNAWIRLKRAGDSFRAFVGTDGVNWNLAAGPVNHMTRPDLLVGVMTTSHNTGAATYAEVRDFEEMIYENATITIVQRPMSQVVDVNNPVTFSVVATVSGAPASELAYQWQLSTDNGVTFANIPGAHSASYTIAQPSLADDGNAYRVIVSVPGVAVLSPAQTPAFLRVGAGCEQPPYPVAAKADGTFAKVVLEWD